MIVDVIQRAKFTKIQRTRQLPYPGQVLVGEGKDVHPDDIIAVASTPSGLQTVDIARGLGVPTSEAHQYLVRQMGESLDEGDIIAQYEGRISRLVRMPVNGVFLDFIDGKAVIASDRSKTQLKARIRGAVETVIPERGVTVSVEGSLLQGVWGNGKVDEGKLKILGNSLEDPLFTQIGDEVEPDQILAAGVCSEKQMMINLANCGAKGLIFSSMSPRLIPLAEALPIPVILLQGFGDLEMDHETQAILESREGDETVVMAVHPNDIPEQRPEVIIPGGEGEPLEETAYREELALGSSVFVLTGKNRGKTGEVVEISEHQMTFESGILGLLAGIRTSEDQVIQVPCPNLIIKRST
jgi:hypothetical protein